ncbi:dentin sialophosphoprotein [Octopus bimaculoides]|uniref:AF4/FMR2 family member lilli n=1 Tax=Octopus bimaculoides TaxID=37653 RepID=A0A0L8HRJ1_OCTBM|nr:dentin sialophosphoprotein [Octopus bimaculoides]XP_052830882.1 dentin sialophosphoprotein [Octopus bimaculoides]XP_052830883.1 dentin sialophosphoprotein [Octopus bimaculoides]|eukprot:XP_014770443.1 PREDICTED: dentin sialophosphoprotein-like [Octopus bimaculoides]
MISYNKEILKEEAKKARQAQVMQAIQSRTTSTPKSNSMLFSEPVRVSSNPKNHSVMHQTINKVLGNYDEVVEEMSKQPGHMIGIDKQTRSTRETNHQAKTSKLRCNGYKMRPQASSKGMIGKDDTPRSQDASSHGRCSGSNSGSGGCSGNSSASYLGHGHGHQDGSRQGLLETPPDGAYSRNSQNSHSMSKDSGHGQNSIDNNYRSRTSQNSRLSTSSRMLSEKHGPDKDFHPKKHSYSSQNSFINPNNKLYTSSSSSSSSTQLSKHPPYPTTNSGNAHVKPNRPLSSLSDKSSSHGSNSEKYYRDKYHSGGEKSLQVDKFHSSADKTHADHKQYSDKTHNESKELSSNVDTSEKSLSNNSGREKSYSAEKGISHHLTKTKSRSPMPSLTPSVQSQQQGPPLLQSQQQQPHLQLQQPSKGPAAPPSAIASTPPPPSLNMDGSRENHHTSLPSSLSPAYIATNTVSSKPSMPTHLNKGLSNSLKVKIIGSNPAKLSSDLDDSESNNQHTQIEKIMKEMCQPEKITGIKTPSVKENLDEENSFLSPLGQSHKHLLSELKHQKPLTPVHQTKLKAISPSLTLHRYQKQNLNTSPVLSDLKEEKNDLDKILAEMTCPESPVTAISTPEKMSENPFARSFKNSHSPSQKTFGLSDSDSDSFDNEEDATQPPNDKPVHSCSSDENTNNQADASILKESKNMTLAAAEIKNHQNTDSVGENQPLKTSPLESTSPTAMPVFPLNAVKRSLQSQEDLSQDLQMSDSDSEALESTKEFPPVFTLSKSSPSSPISRLHHSMDIGAVETRKESVGFDIFSEHPTSESDSESDDVVGKTKSSTLTVNNSAVAESNTVCNNTPLVYSTPARKGSGQFAKKNDNDADDEEEEDGDDDEDDDQSDVEESNELDRIGPAVKHQKPDVVSSSSTSDSETDDDESNVSEKASSASDDDDDNDEEEEDEDKDDHSKQLNSVDGVNDAEQCDSASVQKTPRWCLRAFFSLPNSGNKANQVPKEAEEIVSVSSHTGSNVSASQRSRNNSSSSSSSNSGSSSSSSSGSSSCNENSSPITEANSHCESDDDSNSEKSSAEEKISIIPSDNEDPASSCHKQDVTSAPPFTEDISSKENSLLANTKSVTNLLTWPPGKDIQEFPSPVSSPMSASPTLVHRKLKRKISLPICINTNLLSSIPNVKRRKLSNEPSQPAEHLDTIKSETVLNTWSNQMQSQESVEKQSENKQPWIKRDKSPRRTPNNTESNCCQKRSLTIKINTDLLHFIPAKCLKDMPLLQDVKTENCIEEAVVKPEMQNGNISPSVKVSEPNANTESFVMTQTTTTPVLTESTPCKVEKSDFKFRIPKRNLDSESYDISRPSPKMIKTEGQISKNEDNQLPNISKSESVKSLSLVNSDNNHSSPSTESSTATSKTRISDKDKQISSIDDTKQPCHDKEKDNAVLPASPSECNSSGCSTSSSSSNSNNNNNNNGDDDIDDDGDDSNSDSEHDDSDHNDHVDNENVKKHNNSNGNNQSVNALTNSSSNKKLKTATQANLTSKSSSDNSKDTGKPVATPSPSRQSNSSSALLSPKGSTSSNAADHHHHHQQQPSTSAISMIPVTPSYSNSSNSLRNRPLYKSSSSNHHSSSDGGCSHKGKEKAADHFFQEAKRMKHEGNKLTDIFEKSFLYMNAVVSYVQCGIALEKDQEQRCFRMFGEIFDFLNQIGHYHQYPHEPQISLLRLLLMSRVCKKLYDMKKKVADNLKLAIDEYNKQSSSTSLPSHTPSPHRPNWNTSTPSSRSTPSPSGSIDSIRSQGSNASDARLTPSASSSNAVSATSHSSSHISNNSTSSSSSSNPNSSSLTGSSLPSSSQTVTIPKRIHSITQNYIEILDYIVKTHNYWEQAENQKESCKDFIDLLHTRCNYISLQSSIFQYVEYVRVGLQILRES